MNVEKQKQVEEDRRRLALVTDPALRLKLMAGWRWKSGIAKFLRDLMKTHEPVLNMETALTNSSETCLVEVRGNIEDDMKTFVRFPEARVQFFKREEKRGRRTPSAPVISINLAGLLYLLNWSENQMAQFLCQVITRMVKRPAAIGVESEPQRQAVEWALECFLYRRLVSGTSSAEEDILSDRAYRWLYRWAFASGAAEELFWTNERPNFLRRDRFYEGIENDVWHGLNRSDVPFDRLLTPFVLRLEELEMDGREIADAFVSLLRRQGKDQKVSLLVAMFESLHREGRDWFFIRACKQIRLAPNTTDPAAKQTVEREMKALCALGSHHGFGENHQEIFVTILARNLVETPDVTPMLIGFVVRCAPSWGFPVDEHEALSNKILFAAYIRAMVTNKFKRALELAALLPQGAHPLPRIDDVKALAAELEA